MTAFRIGQEVVCVDDASAHLALHPITRGSIYTISGFCPDPPPSWSEDQLPRLYLRETGDQLWWQSRFRPVVKTDISVFTAILEQAPKRERVDA